MSGFERVVEFASQHGRGLVTDLAFAVVWVTLVEGFFAVTNGPQWAYYMFMLAGIVAYFGFFASYAEATDEDATSGDGGEA